MKWERKKKLKELVSFKHSSHNSEGLHATILTFLTKPCTLGLGGTLNITLLPSQAPQAFTRVPHSPGHIFLSWKSLPLEQLGSPRRELELGLESKGLSETLPNAGAAGCRQDRANMDTGAEHVSGPNTGILVLSVHKEHCLLTPSEARCAYHR